MKEPKFKEELQGHEDTLKSMLNSIENNGKMAPVGQLMACVASAYKANVNSLEQQYQANKKLEQQLKALSTNVFGEEAASEHSEPVAKRHKAVAVASSSSKPVIITNGQKESDLPGYSGPCASGDLWEQLLA